MKETFSEWMFSHLILLSSGKLSNVSLHHNTPSLSDSHTPLIFTSLLPPASPSLSRPQLLGGNRCGLSVDGVESIQFKWL